MKTRLESQNHRQERALLPQFVILGICFFILLFAVLLSPPAQDDGPVRLAGIPLPQTCQFRALTGIPCPGCGLTRSLTAAVHGRIGDSFRHHRLGAMTLVYILVQFFHRLGLILLPVFWLRTFGAGKILDRGIIVLAVLFGLNWIATLILL